MKSQALVESGSQVNEKWAYNDETILHSIVFHSRLKDDVKYKISKYLIEKGADVNAKDRAGKTISEKIGKGFGLKQTKKLFV